MRPVISALDLGLTTGLCWGAPGERPQFGCLRLPGPERGNGARFGALSNAVSDLITEHRPALVVKEAPMRLGGMTSTNTALGYTTVTTAPSRRGAGAVTFPAGRKRPTPCARP